jgi:hypothetical protein
MQEPSDPLNTQSSSGEEAQTDEPVVSRQETPGELRNGGAENDATDNAPTVPEQEVQSHLPNETASMSKSADEPAANFAQDETPLETVCTPLVELIRLESDGPINIATIHREGSPAQVALKHRDRIPAMPPSFYKSLVLPSKPEAFGSARELFDSILALLQKHVQLSKKECSILAYWSIATWFVDYLPFLSPLVITGTASAADLLLRTLVAVCRRPVLLADVNPAVLRALPLADLKPTLLIREPQLSKRTAALLDASNPPGYLVYGSKDFQQVYCAKCIYVGELAKDQLFTSNSIHIHVGENSLGVLYAPPTESTVEKFQNRLLYYRLLGHDRVAASNFRVAGFRPEVCAIAQVLGASIVGDPELQRGIIELLKERDEQARVDRAGGQNGVVLRAVLRHCHQPDRQQVLVREIATTANDIYEEEEETLKISNETVGHVLKSLGLYTRRLGNVGRGLMLDKATQSRVHELSRACEVLPDGSGVPACGHCYKLQLPEAQEVV